jgi:hypothetical protein
MVSKMSAVTYICPLCTLNKFTWISMIVDDCSDYQKQKEY